MAKPAAITPDLRDAINAYKSGKTLSECAAMSGITGPTFRNRLIKLGIPLRDPHWLAESRKLSLPATLVEEFHAGTDIKSLTRRYGLSANTIRRRLTESGVNVDRHTRSTPQGLIEDYLGGLSVKAVGAKYGLERSTVYRMLREVEVNGRDRSEAMQLRWQRASVAERRTMLDRAHEAARGRVVSAEERGKIATAKTGVTFSANETAIGALLADLGYDITYGVPCDRYNIDVVIAGTVAVEVNGGNWHEIGPHRARFGERARHILDAGYSLAIIWADKTSYPVSVRCAQHLATLAEITRGHPSIGRQHWVIRGDGHFLAVREDDGDEVPFITSSGRCDS